MGNQDDRDIFHVIQCTSRPYDIFAPVGIQHCRRLVQHNTFRMHRKHACDGNALLLSAGKLVRRIFSIFIHSDCF